MTKALRSSLILLVLATGCVSQAVRDQIKTEVAVHDRVLKLWPGLTPAQRHEAYQKSGAAWRAQDRNVNGEKHDEPAAPKVGP